MGNPPVTQNRLRIGSQEMAYFAVGAGRIAIIIHGVGGHKEDWAGVAQALAATHRVIALDMLGFGGSSKVGDLSIPAQARAIEALLIAEGAEHADIVGNSVGGWVAACFAATCPQAVRRLILIDTAGFRAMFEGTPPVNFDPSTEAEMQALIDITINSVAARTPGLAQAALQAYVASGEKAVSTTWGAGLYGSPRLEDLLGHIKAPTLVLWGADDKLFPSTLASTFATQLVDGRAELIPAAGHFPQIDQPAATIAAITAFLST